MWRFGGPLLAATGCIVEVGGGERTWTFEEPHALQVRLSSGDLEVESVPGDELTVHWEGGGLGDNAAPDVRDDEGWVVLDANGGPLGGGSIEVEVPDGTSLDLSVERGSLDVELYAPADIYACVGAGSIRLDVAPGPYELDVGVGVGVIGTDIWHEAGASYRIEICLGAGDVEIRGS